MGAQDNSKKGQRNSCLYTNKKTNILIKALNSKK